MSQRNLITNFNASPFYDDFDEAKKFLRILFRPTYPIQARELTQLQTILSNQVSKFGSSIYKDGSTVTGGSLSLTDVVSIKLPTGTVFTGGTNNLTSLLSQSDAGTGYQVNDVLKLSSGASDSILATIGSDSTFTYELVNNVTPAGFFGKVLTENSTVTSGAQNAQFEVNQKITTSTVPAYTIVHSDASDSSFTVDETITQTHADTTTATGVVLTSTHDADADTVTTVLIGDTVTGTFDTLTAAVGGTSSRSGTPTSVTVDKREENPVFRVQGFTSATTGDLNPTIFGSYETEDEFINGDELRLLGSDDSTILTTSLGTLPSGTIQYDSQIASVTEGSFYTNGFFVQIDQQSIVLNKYDRDITARIGYDVGEVTVTETDDPTLLDNATGATNANAPGAHRFKLSLTLTYKTDLATNDDVANTSDINFYQIGRIESGSMVDIKARAAGSSIASSIAKSIHDVNGNFVINPFIFTVKENSQFTIDPTSHTAGSATIRATTSIKTLTAADLAGKTIEASGVPLKILSAVQNPAGSTPASSYTDIFDLTLQDVSSGTVGGAVPSWLTTVSESALDVNDPDNFQATVAPGLAYIDGFRYETVAPKKLDLEKTTTSKHVSDSFTFSTNVSSGNYLPVTYQSGEFIAADFAFGTKVLLFSSKEGGAKGYAHGGMEKKAIGTARVKQLRRDPVGVAAATFDTLEVYLFDIKFNDGSTATTPGPTTAGTALTRITRTVNDTTNWAGGTANGTVNTAGQKVVQFANLAATVTFTDGDPTTVSGGTADFDTTVKANDWIVTAGGKYYKVNTITDTSNLEIYVSVGDADSAGIDGTENNVAAYLANENLLGASFVHEGVRYRIVTVDNNSNQVTLNINLQDEIADDTVLNFDFDSRNIKSIRFGVNDNTHASADGAIYDVNSSAEVADANSYSATQLQETDKKKLIFPISERYVESIKNTTVMYYKTSALTSNGSGVLTPSLLSSSNGTESIVQDINQVLITNAATGAHISATAISSSTVTCGTASTAMLVSVPVIRTSIPTGGFDGDLSIPTDYIFGNIVDTDLFSASNFVDSAAGQVRILAGTFADGAVTSTGAKNWKRIGLTGVTKLVKVYEEVGAQSGSDNSLTDTAKFTDITSNFDIDFGQYEEYVDQAKIALKAGASIPSPSQDLIVVVDRVKTTTDSGGGNIFYSANSYSTLYSSLIPAVDFGETLDFRRCVDFRPRVAETAAGTNTATVGDHSLTFTDTATVPFASNTNTMTGQITSYYGRRDKLLITSDLDMEIVQGKPNPTPESPEADARSLVLYDVSIIPYSLKKTGVNVKSIDNAHFTQSDIARINERVEDLEKDTQLDNVENAILSAEVNSSTNTNLFKTGVLVDSFRNLDVAYPQSDDFVASLDQTKGQLRPAFDTYCLSVDFDENDALSTAQETPDGILLAPLDDTPSETVIKQVTASKAENINPFNVTTFEGTTKMFPEKDFWKDEKISDVVIQDQSNAEAWNTIMNGKQNRVEYGSWETKWTGHETRENLGQTLTNWMAPPGHKKKDRFRTGRKLKEIRKITYKAEIREKTIGSNIVDQSVIPFMRKPPNGSYDYFTADSWGAKKSNKTRAGIHFNAEGMKPRTTVYPYFDGTAIIDNIRPAIVIKVANNSTNLAVYGTSTTDNWEGGARDIGASFVGGSKRSTVTLSTSAVTGDDAKCILVLKSADVNSLYWHVVPPTRASGLYGITKIADFTGGGSASTIAIDGTSMTITGMVRPKLAGEFRMRTDPTGAVGGIFEVPAQTFATGNRTLLLTDSTTSDITSAKTYSKRDFSSSGMKLTVENQILQTRVPVKHVDVSYEDGGAVSMHVGTVSF